MGTRSDPASNTASSDGRTSTGHTSNDHAQNEGANQPLYSEIIKPQGLRNIILNNLIS